jgi:short-subunit dehydrogenase
MPCPFDKVTDGASTRYEATDDPGESAMILSGARVLLTGASGGIGCALVAALRRRGAQLVISSRDPSVSDDGADGLTFIRADLTDEEQVRHLADAAGEIDVLINNAGVGWYGNAAQMPCTDVRRLVEINMLAPLLLTRLLLPGMTGRKRGHIVFVGSVAGHLGVENEAVYSATKAALRTYAEALRAEVRRQGVGVSVVSPGAVATKFFEHRGAAYQRTWPSAIPAEAVAAAVVHAVERSDKQVFVPHWLRVPALLHDGLPAIYRGFANKFG